MTNKTFLSRNAAFPSSFALSAGCKKVLLAVGLGLASASFGAAGTTACNTAWISSTAYVGGQSVSYADVNYTANWWTQGQNPSTNSGGSGTGEPWTSTGACGTTTPSPTPTPTPTPTPSPVPPPSPVTSNSGTRFFSPYVDMSLSADEQLLAMQQQSGIKAVTVAFLVGMQGTCNVSWGGYNQALPNDTLWDGQTIQSIVQSLQNDGVQVTMSFGGAVGPEPALTCTNATQLQALYQSVITRYKVTRLDFDIEGSAISDTTGSIARRDQALKALKAANPNLVISYTLPVMTTGLSADGVNILNRVKADGVSLSALNIMAMDYGSANSNMEVAAADAATGTENQLVAAGLSSTTVGITPMIGVNDSQNETFTLANAQTLLTFAEANKFVSSIGMWSLGRDNGSCPGQSSASPTCSGLTQANYAFSAVFTAIK